MPCRISSSHSKKEGGSCAPALTTDTQMLALRLIARAIHSCTTPRPSRLARPPVRRSSWSGPVARLSSWSRSSSPQRRLIRNWVKQTDLDAGSRSDGLTRKDSDAGASSQSVSGSLRPAPVRVLLLGHKARLYAELHSVFSCRFSSTTTPLMRLFPGDFLTQPLDLTILTIAFTRPTLLQRVAHPLLRFLLPTVERRRIDLGAPQRFRHRRVWLLACSRIFSFWSVVNCRPLRGILFPRKNISATSPVVKRGKSLIFL